jgi:hypothetical protein
VRWPGSARILRALFFVSLTGCASAPQLYTPQGRVSLEVVYDEDSGIFTNKKLEVGIFFVDANCMTNYQGTMILDGKSNATTMIPASTWIGYAVSFGKNNFWMGTSQTITASDVVLFKTKADGKYQIEATSKKGMNGDQLYRIEGSRKIEVEPMNERCVNGKLK